VSTERRKTRHDLPWQSTSRKLPSAEWDFRNVAKDEALPCLYHEYGRECPAFIAQVEAWRKRQPEAFAVVKMICQAISAAPPTDTAPLEQMLGAIAHRQPLKSGLIPLPGKLGRAWAAFAMYSIAAPADVMYPDGLKRDDYRTALYNFPPFPGQPWQNIAPPVRRVMPFMFEAAFRSARLPDNAVSASNGVKETADILRQMAQKCGRPIDEQKLAQAAQSDMEDHLFAPCLIEAASFGRLPASFRFEKNGTQVWAGRSCREHVQFILNWAHSNDELVKAFRAWLKTPGRRPHKKIEHPKFTKPLEHLKKLGAMRILHTGASAFTAADKYGQLYKNADRFLKAKAEAETLIRKLFPTPCPTGA
jgi:hypothetical protein